LSAQCSPFGGTSPKPTPFTVDAGSKPEIDAAQLAREFVPDAYDKPRAWALGRDGVNDGRAEKKTFFLQSCVLDTESACSREANETLDGDVPVTDLRELVLVLAHCQPELLAEAAREWGTQSAWNCTDLPAYRYSTPTTEAIAARWFRTIETRAKTATRPPTPIISSGLVLRWFFRNALSGESVGTYAVRLAPGSYPSNIDSAPPLVPELWVTPLGYRFEEL
jgi:hypothetical protein